ncbi:MAG: hypothetical protein WAW13_05060 [Minisyncoccia bacterium]
MTYTIIHILKSFVFFTILLASFFFFSTQSTHAYFTTNQSAMVLNDHTILFLIDYTFGTPTHEVTLPVKALNSTEKQNDAVSFSVLDKDNAIIAGKTTSIVLSNAALNAQRMYVTPKSVGKKFTLAVFFTPESYELHKEYRLQVNHLPFNFDGTQQLQLNPSELVYYTTKFISL